jgi:ATP-dependent Clp endopeptidase proteolytic subunit ClpP
MEKEEEHEPEFVKVQGSDVYFHCDVTPENVLEFNLKLKKLEIDLVKKHLDVGLDHIKPEIRVFIHSNGGDMHAGLSAMDCIRSMRRSKVRTIADGVCASAATFMLLGGRTRYMTKNSYVLIHQLNLDGTWGKYEDFKDQMENLDNFMNKLKEIYSEETSIPIEMMGDVMKRDIYFDSKKCLDLKIVDSILQ